MILQAQNLSYAYGTTPVLSNVNLKLEPGITALIGPNAAGKSTLLKCLAGLLRTPRCVTLDGHDLATIAAPMLSRAVSYMAQDLCGGGGLTVFETVLLGRLHQLSWRVSGEDRKATEAILDEIGLAPVAGRRLDTLSGGQIQLVYIAQALAREPRILLMDEPISNLDMHHQFRICDLVKTLTARRRISTVMALHDLNLASRFADTICVLHNGRLIAQGTPASLVTPGLIASVYQVHARVTLDEEGRPWICPLRACPPEFREP